MCVFRFDVRENVGGRFAPLCLCVRELERRGDGENIIEQNFGSEKIGNNKQNFCRVRFALAFGVFVVHC